ncbi:cytochrome c [Sulfurirhabdus autotrophica]|uniref:Cytochrome c domain-containing protein n=1 Tax=Sulfurirhabdus autotrophica TaxID=1706046 RepID=A0A4R3YDN4_9PROT|nr:cytochrome c [Sulfurirhabdus autotrophica]TCV88944.1 hypothetical protein EDC63_10315 [Sulfurirhabdus autotrophica]
MRIFLTTLVLCLAVVPAFADNFAKGDPKVGKSLVDKSCAACHISMFGGDGSKIYTRPDRKVKNAQQLLSRIRICNTNAGANWYPDEEMHVAAYLNLNYYHFK